MTAHEAAPGDGRRRFGGLWRQRNFRLFWIGETVNQLGSAMALIGVPLLAVLFLHATAGAGKWRSVIGGGELAPAGRFVS